MVKRLIPVLSSVIGAIVIVLFSSCDGDNSINPNQGQGLLLSDSSSTRGRLTVRVLDDNERSINGTELYLFADYEAIDRSIYLLNLRTDSRGESNFGFLNLGNYYVVADSKELNVSDTSVVQIRSLIDVVKVIRLVP